MCLQDDEEEDEEEDDEDSWNCRVTETSICNMSEPT